MNGDIFAALALGFASSLHCIGMCGGVHSLIAVNGRQVDRAKIHPGDVANNKLPYKQVSFNENSVDDVFTPQLIASSTQPVQSMAASGLDWLRLPVFSFGRVSSYALAGLALGALSFGIQQRFPDMFSWMRLLSGVLLTLLALFIGRWWAGISVVEKAANALWQPLMGSFSSFSNHKSLGSVFVLGSLWGWIPCGAVYTTLAWAALAADPVQSSLLMLSFGLGTMPALLVAGYSLGFMQRFMQQPILRVFFASSLLAYGVWIMLSSYSSIDGQSNHLHHHDAHGGEQLNTSSTKGFDPNTQIGPPPDADCH